MEKVAFFTGHRVLSVPEERLAVPLRKKILELYDAGIHTFRSGGAEGFDTLAALEVLRIRAMYHRDIKLVLMLPFPRTYHQDSRFNLILRQADEVLYAGTHFVSYCYFMRDEMLVKDADVGIAYCCGSSGGTVYTMNAAERMGVPVINIASMLD